MISEEEKQRLFDLIMKSELEKVLSLSRKIRK